MSGIVYLMFVSILVNNERDYMVKYQKVKSEKIEFSVWSAQSDVLFGQSFGASSSYKRGEKKRLKVHCTLIATLKALSFTKHCKTCLVVN